MIGRRIGHTDVLGQPVKLGSILAVSIATSSTPALRIGRVTAFPVSYARSFDRLEQKWLDETPQIEVQWESVSSRPEQVPGRKTRIAAHLKHFVVLAQPDTDTTIPGWATDAVRLRRGSSRSPQQPSS